MRKLNLLMGLAILGLAVFVTSCTKDTTGKPPSINFKGGSGYVSADDSLALGATFKVGITASPNTDSQEKLVGFKVVRTFNNVPTTVVDTTLDKLTSFSADIITNARNTAGSERLTFTITDKNSESAEIALNIYTKAAAVETPLGAEQAFSLIYKGSSQSDGANENTTIGIKYSSNTNSTTAQFATISGGQFVIITQSEFNALTTKEGVASKYTSGIVVNQFTAQSDANFVALYFISKVSSNYYLVRMTNLKFSPGNNKADFAYKN